MTKVERLREVIGHDFRSFATFEVVDALIAAVRVEEAERIRVKLETCWKDIASAYPKEADNDKQG